MYANWMPSRLQQLTRATAAQLQQARDHAQERWCKNSEDVLNICPKKGCPDIQNHNGPLSFHGNYRGIGAGATWGCSPSLPLLFFIRLLKRTRETLTNSQHQASEFLIEKELKEGIHLAGIKTRMAHAKATWHQGKGTQCYQQDATYSTVQPQHTMGDR